MTPQRYRSSTTILDKIIANKIKQVKKNKITNPIVQLEQTDIYKRRVPLDLAQSIRNGSGIIAEYKIGSPSKGRIHPDADPVKISTGYISAGVSGISCVTDSEYFFGSNAMLTQIRATHRDIPILRKDFIIDTYQIIESKAIGTDTILLIAQILKPAIAHQFAQFAQDIGLSVLVEFHAVSDIKAYTDAHIFDYVDIVGINNRDLTNFTEDSVNPSRELFAQLPPNLVKISESCIKTPKQVNELYTLGFDGCLIGEQFMKASDPGQACTDFIYALQK